MEERARDARRLPDRGGSVTTVSAPVSTEVATVLDEAANHIEDVGFFKSTCTTPDRPRTGCRSAAARST